MSLNRLLTFPGFFTREQVHRALNRRQPGRELNALVYRNPNADQKPGFTLDHRVQIRKRLRGTVESVPSTENERSDPERIAFTYPECSVHG